MGYNFANSEHILMAAPNTFQLFIYFETVFLETFNANVSVCKALWIHFCFLKVL